MACNCKDCGVEYSGFDYPPKMIMIHDELWISICDKKEDTICDTCMEKRLGRRIEESDLKPMPDKYQKLFNEYHIPCNQSWLNYRIKKSPGLYRGF